MALSYANCQTYDKRVPAHMPTCSNVTKKQIGEAVGSRFSFAVGVGEYSSPSPPLSRTFPALPEGGRKPPIAARKTQSAKRYLLNYYSS